MDVPDNPTGFHLTPGQARDLDGADVLLPQIAANTIIADKGYAADQRILKPLAEAGKIALILPSTTMLNHAMTTATSTRPAT